MKLILIGGHSRNVGKTSLMCGIIKAFAPLAWTAIKITQFGHGVCSVNGADCGCVVTEHRYAITEEHKSNSKTDTGRYIIAGAKRALWVRTKTGDLIEALPSLRTKIANDQYVIIESNSLRRFITPDLYLQILDANNEDFKPSARYFFDLADGYCLVQHHDKQSETLDNALNTWPALLKREKERKPIFFVDVENNFINDEVIEFVRKGLDI